jgi:hypothetical protein
MEEIARHHVAPATKTYINKNVIRGIGAFFLTLILALVTYVMSQFKWAGAGAGNGSSLLPNNPNLNLERLNNVKVSGAFNSTYITVFMLITVVMGFMLLDMYLQRKRQLR